MIDKTLKTHLYYQKRDELNIIARKLKIKGYRTKTIPDLIEIILSTKTKNEIEKALSISFWDKHRNAAITIPIILGILGLIFTFCFWYYPKPVDLTKTKFAKTRNLPITTSPPKLPQTTEELKEHLREQIHFLQRSSQHYDSGLKEEAKRMASTLCILLCNKQESPSLFSQLRIQEDIQFLDTAFEDNPNNLLPYAGLVLMKLQRGKTGLAASYEPMFSAPPPAIFAPKLIPFETWWNNIIIDDKKGGKFSRGALILAIAKGDGGLSVASTLDPDYVRLSRKNALGWAVKGEKPFLGSELASVRQITFEFLTRLKKEHPQYFDTPKEKKK